MLKKLPFVTAIIFLLILAVPILLVLIPRLSPHPDRARGEPGNEAICILLITAHTLAQSYLRDHIS